MFICGNVDARQAMVRRIKPRVAAGRAPKARNRPTSCRPSRMVIRMRQFMYEVIFAGAISL